MFIQTSLTSNLILVMNKKLMHILFNWYISVHSMERHVHQQTNQSEIMNVWRVTIHVPCPYLDRSILLLLILKGGFLNERLTLERCIKISKLIWNARCAKSIVPCITHPSTAHVADFISVDYRLCCQHVTFGLCFVYA